MHRILPPCDAGEQLRGKNFMVQHAGVGGKGKEVLEVRRLDELPGEEGGVFVGLVACGRVGVLGAAKFGVNDLVSELGGDERAGVGFIL